MSFKLNWYFQVDWRNDGVWSNEAGRLFGLTTQRGREYFLSSNGTGLEPVRVGTLTAELTNLDGRYNPRNSRSPLYPYVESGAPFRLLVGRGASMWPVMTGRLTNVTPKNTLAPTVTIEGEDDGAMLRDAGVSTEIQTNYRIDQAIAAVLTAAGWTGSTELDNFSDVLPYWWARGNKAWTEIQELVDASVGRFFIAADGTAKYYSRLRGRPTQFILTQKDIAAGIEVPTPREVVRNDISMTVNTRTLVSGVEIWKMGDAPLVEAGATLTVWASFKYGNESVPALAVTTPVATTDYTMNSLANGSGTNLTASFSIVMTVFAESAKLEITNNGAADGYITLLKLRGNVLTTTPSILNTQDAASISRYGLRQFSIDSNWLQQITVSGDIMLVLLDYLSGAQAYPTLKLRDKPVHQFGADLFDAARLNIPSEHINGEYVLGYIEHKWLDRTGQLVETVLRFEPEFGAADDYWVFTAQLGLTTRFAG